MTFTLPRWIIRLLLRVHVCAQATPYYHLDGYMLRWWVLGDRCPERNSTHPAWHGRVRGPVYRWLTRRLCVRAHTILRSDSDRALHDHPAWSVSIVLDGGYWEVLAPTHLAMMRPTYYRGLLATLAAYGPGERADELSAWGIHWRGPGAVVFRSATAAHRLVLPPGRVAVSLFIMGRKTNSWGFYPDGGHKVGWRKFLTGDDAQP